MNKKEFEAQLKADGYTEVEIKVLVPRPANEPHGHPYDIRGLVLAGTFTVIQNRTPRVYRSGEIFAVPAHQDHAEEIGADGAQILVGRKY